MGAHDLSANEPTQVSDTTTDITTHSGYNSFYLTNDVGLVHLSTPVSLSCKLQSKFLQLKLEDCVILQQLLS